MLLPNRPSPGVYSLENDRSQTQTLATNGFCTLCLPFPRGESGVHHEIRTEEELYAKLGTATGRYANSVLIAKILLGKARQLNITPVGIGRKKAGVFLTLFDNTTTFRASSAQGITDIDQVAFTDRDIGIFVSLSGYEDANKIYLTVEPDFNDFFGRKSIVKVYQTGSLTPVEQFSVTTFYYKDDSGNQFFIEDVINTQSNLIRFRLNTNNFRLLADPNFQVINSVAGGPANPLQPTAPNGQFVGGSDGDIIDIDHSDPIIANRSLAAVLECWDNYDDWEDTKAGILCSGGLEHPVIANKLDELSMSRMDCIACSGIPVLLQSLDRAVAYRRGITPYQSAVFSITGSWSCLTNSDVLARDSDNARNFYVPASVCMAYAMLTTDQIASWLAPAGTVRGNLPFAISVRHTFKQTPRDTLNDNQINPIVAFRGEGIQIFGADTLMTTRSALNDIGVRRLLAMLHASVRANNLRSVFEPNDDVLKAQQQAGMESILEPIKAGRGLDWYQVVCNYTNNTAQDEARGDLIIDVFLDPTRYTKRIHLTAIVPQVGEIQYALDLINRGQI